MTNTEAIKILNKCRDRGFERTTYTKEEYHTARDMAIKALQEQNCDQCEVGNACLYCEHEFKAKETQADGEYISKSDMIDWLKDIKSKIKPQGFHTASEFEIAENQILNLIQMLQMGAFPTVAIPPEHDGCKDCVYQANPQDAMPCRECKHNYMDKWKAKANKVGHWVGIDEYPHEDYECDRCGYVVSTFTANIKPHEEYKFCPNCGVKMGGEEE